MKDTRHNLIIKLIKEKEIETQDDLAKELKDAGIDVTQATISRDIKNLRLVKIMDKNGKYKYIYNEQEDFNYKYSDKLIRIFAESIVSVDYSHNIIVLKTISGSAKVASEAVDNMNWSEILGTVAGDNTILLVIKNLEDVEKVIAKIHALKER